MDTRISIYFWSVDIMSFGTLIPVLKSSFLGKHKSNAGNAGEKLIQSRVKTTQQHNFGSSVFLIGFLIAAFLYGCHILRLTAAPIGKQKEVTLAWTPVSGYKTYKLTYGQLGSSNTASIAITGMSNYSVLLRAGTTYQFSVQTVGITNGKPNIGMLSAPHTITYELAH